jgi:hypothetical protein
MAPLRTTTLALTIGTAAVLLTGAGCAQQAGTPAPSTVTAPSTVPISETAPATSAPDPSAPAAAPAGKPVALPKPTRAVYVQAVGNIEDRVLTVAADKTIGTHPLGGDTGDRELFAIVPLQPGGKTYHITTAKLLEGGEPSCLEQVAAKLAARPCDAARAAQSFEIAPRGKGYELIVNGSNVQLDKNDKVEVEGRGEAPALTTFTFIDGGTDAVRAGD